MKKQESPAASNTTKQKIAGTLRQMMMERPYHKITVRNLMDATGMKRQSFYYHFQDLRDVLCWICRQELTEPLQRSDLDITQWILYALILLEKDRAFYRRLFAAGGPELMQEVGGTVVFDRVKVLLYGQEASGNLDVHQNFAVEFTSRAVTCYALDFLSSRRPMDRSAAQEHVRCLLETFGLAGNSGVRGE